MAIDITDPMAASFVSATAAINQEGRWEPFMALWAEDAVWRASGRNPFSGVHRGHEAIQGWFRSMVELGMIAEPLDILNDDEHFVFFIRLHGEHDGKRLDQVHTDAWTVRDGKFVDGCFLPEDQQAWDDFLG